MGSLRLNDNTLDSLPKNPGVYIFMDKERRIIYIGKAKNLSNRIRSYFQKKESANNLNIKSLYFSQKVSFIDFIVTANEFEALILESSLIKKNRPKYNISLKDDKSYPFIAITVSEDFPRVLITRNRNIKGAKYFGPYTNVNSLRTIIEYLNKIFQIRDCKGHVAGKINNKPCLNFHIHLCSGPCVNKITSKDYKKNIDLIMMLLKGKDKKIIQSLQNQMERSSRDKDFEKAMTLREKIYAINELYNTQRIHLKSENAKDFIAFYRDDEISAAAVIMYRDKEFAGLNNFVISHFMHLREEDILSDFIKKYYEDINNVAPEIYIPFEIADKEMIAMLLSKAKGKKINIKLPRTASSKEIMNMAVKNAQLYANKKKFEKDLNFSKFTKDIIKLKEALGLKNMPRRMECFDISNLKDSFAVGSMAVFVDGEPSKKDYRHFKIKTVHSQNDYAMLAEILIRRLRYLKHFKMDIEDSFYRKPDLIIIDGGLGQFNTASEVISKKDYNLDIDLISIAKKEEMLFSCKYPDGLTFKKEENFLRLVIKARDEAHRFAISYHKKMRGKNMTKSILDEVKGIGDKKVSYIFSKYKSVEELKDLTIRDLAEIKGITYKDATNIFNAINR